MTTTVIIPTKNEVIGVRKIMPQLNLEWADEWIVMDEIQTMVLLRRQKN